MIAKLSGVVADKNIEVAIIDVNGVGYEVFMPVDDLAAIGAIGSKTTLHIYTHVREDMLRLFGFCQAHRKQAFVLLIGVAGVGPKTALAILSGIDVTALSQAIEERDIARLSKVPGIGKKTAERICIELKDKLCAPTGSSRQAVSSSREEELHSALESLGYKRPAIEATSRQLKDLLDTGTSLEDLVREALKRLHA